MIEDFISSIPSYEVLSIIVSICALLFAVGSFWWMHWRKGKLRVSPPRSYAAHGSQDGPLVIKLPLVLFNTGAPPIVVQNLRLRIANGGSIANLDFIATSPNLGDSEGREPAVQFPVLGRQALPGNFEFQRRPGRFTFDEDVYEIELDGLLDEKRRWKRLLKFDLRVSSRSTSSINSRLIVHDNLASESPEFDFGS